MGRKWMLILVGGLAGAVNGLFGAGGGMILVPLLSIFGMADEQIFPASVSIIFPICFVSLGFTMLSGPLPYLDALPYLIGGLLGGLLSAITGNKIPVKWLHRFLGLLIWWGGFRYLWS